MTGEWQPIETAPKNGTHVLLTTTSRKHPVVVARFRPSFLWTTIPTSCPVTPIAWMQLPHPAPKGERA